MGVFRPYPLSTHCSSASWRLLRPLSAQELSLVCRLCPDPTQGRLESRCPGSNLTEWQWGVEDICLIFLAPQVDKSEVVLHQPQSHQHDWVPVALVICSPHILSIPWIHCLTPPLPHKWENWWNTSQERLRNPNQTTYQGSLNMPQYINNTTKTVMTTSWCTIKYLFNIVSASKKVQPGHVAFSLFMGLH